MDLLNAYENYKEFNKNFVDFINDLITNDFSNIDKADIMDRLIAGKDFFSNLQVKCETIDIESKDMNNLKDLQYLLADGLFLTIDLINFYSLNEYDRFRMRASNYINKGRLTEMFKQSKNCSIMDL
ncbi:hypothetical protein CM240_3345 [Clostridium bornimense]|uniref:Uncharacterized protein n=1 Tax=Clostridium bornimense TaxID=1216932 RepID=W6S7T8_9CLOT|nr:hypothetical protein [Clostridium bornimense]CDM70462.1 hypothetical protein CM240_3345 [Clostridium bornimense]